MDLGDGTAVLGPLVGEATVQHPRLGGDRRLVHEDGTGEVQDGHRRPYLRYLPRSASS